MKSAFPYVFALAASGLLLHTQVYGEGLAVTAEPLESVTVVGEPVVLRCEFANEAEAPAVLDLGYNDVMKISFVLDPAGQSPVALAEIQMGGGGDFGTHAAEITPHDRINRYIVLNQWFRPSKAGVYPLEMVVKTGDRTITGRFQVTISAGDATAVGARVEGLIQKYLKWPKYLAGRAKPNVPEYWEGHNYKHTLLIALTYVYQTFPQIAAEAKKRHGDNAFVAPLLEEASWIGPGGSRAID